MKTVFKGRLLNVVIRKERLPSGYSGTFEMIVHPGASLIVPLIGRDKVIMLKQLRPVIDSYIYELPAGTLAKGERPLACARREIIEETGYSAKRMKLLGSIYLAPGYSTERIHIYRADKLTYVGHPGEADEVIETKVMSKKEVSALFRSGRITDAKTIAALAMCGWV
jgi:ADP-ribose pyrophosphatase